MSKYIDAKATVWYRYNLNDKYKIYENGELVSESNVA